MALGDAISTSAPHFTTISHTLAPTSYWGSLTAPYETNEWWNNVVLGNGQGTVIPNPYFIRCKDEGMDVCIPAKTVATTYITTAFLQNIQLYSSETIASHALQNRSKLHFTMRWQEDATHYMQAPVVKGMAYATMTYTNVTPLIKTQHAITGVNGSGTPGAVTATKFKVTLNNGQTWIIYATSSITLTWSNTGGWRMLASARYTGSLRVAYLGNSSYETDLDTYSTAIPTAGTFAYSLTSANVMTYTFTWTKSGSGSCLMYCLPHHRDILTSPTYGTPRANCMKGDMYAVVGDVWTLVEPLTTIQYGATNSIDSAKLDSIIAALTSDQSKVPTSYDPYFFGKQIAAMGRLALIADETNQNSIATTIRSNMKTYENPWLLGTNTDPYAVDTAGPQLRSDTTWKGIVTKRGVADSGADFGQGYYNDHHFHYGYHVYAAACIAKTDSTWKTTYADKVNVLLRDYGNPSASDTYFPIFRSKDLFDGHSWAHGITVWGDGKNQESISESVNGYYAMYLWGLATGDDNIKNTGRMLLAMELRSGKKYWQIKTADSIYSSTFGATKIVGILSAGKVDYATFFGANVEFIHEIQSLPFTPITEELLDATWLAEEYPVVATALTRSSPVLSDGWKGFIYCKQALIDNAASYANILALNTWDDGNSKTNALYWNATRTASAGGETLESTPADYENFAGVTNFKVLADNARTTVATDALNNTTASLTFSVTDGSKFPTTTSSQFYATAWRSDLYSNPGDDPYMEKMLITARSGNLFTATRNILGTTATAKTGVVSIAVFTLAQHFEDIHGAINRLQNFGTPTPTTFAFNDGQLQKKDPGSSTWENFEVKGTNFTVTPPGFTPDQGLIQDPFCNQSVVRWGAENFKAIGGNTVRIYHQVAGQISNTFTGSISGHPDKYQILRSLDDFYANGVYVLIDIFVRFYSSYNTGQKKAWYKSHVQQAMMEIVHLTKNHPAVMGYVLGNETNLYKDGYQNLGGIITLDEWWQFANEVGEECQYHDPYHIFGISSGLSDITALNATVAAESAGKLSNFDFHGVNLYWTNEWKRPSNTATTFWDLWTPTNSKPVIILETGVDSFDNTTKQQDEATQAEYTAALWNTYDRDKCAGICFFSQFDELWKTFNDSPTQTPPTNDYNYTDVGYPAGATNDGFSMPDEYGNEQHFGWWGYIKPIPYASPPRAKQVVFTMKDLWT